MISKICSLKQLPRNPMSKFIVLSLKSGQEIEMDFPCTKHSQLCQTTVKNWLGHLHKLAFVKCENDELVISFIQRPQYRIFRNKLIQLILP